MERVTDVLGLQSRGNQQLSVGVVAKLSPCSAVRANAAPARAAFEIVTPTPPGAVTLPTFLKCRRTVRVDLQDRLDGRLTGRHPQR